ncbi:MAG: phosphoribosyl-AMP cyclohydrolase [Lachnospiraceae bacterium]
MLDELKKTLIEQGNEIHPLECSIPFSEFKLDSNGLIPVVVQEESSCEVLMVAYMNEEAFNITKETGIMTYYSRSRNEIWVKGLTSGHYQSVISMEIDCDNDTLLAKVVQRGAACHTGNHSCFYRNLLKRKQSDV